VAVPRYVKEAKYDNEFFDEIERGSVESARVVVPLVLQLVNPRSVIDVGCGRGAWLSVFRENGVETAHGIDGAYVEPENLLVPFDSFSTANLENGLVIARKYDLSVCLEVVEHLRYRAALNVVRSLTNAAPVVRFTAAIPGQGGTHHVNEQWPQHWDRVFSSHKFRRIDALRFQVATNPKVKWWYRQSIVIYASDVAIEANDKLRKSYEDSKGYDLELVSRRILQDFEFSGGILRQLMSALRRALLRRI